MAKPVFQTTQTPEMMVVDLTGDLVKILLARRTADKILYEDVRQQKFSEGADEEISNFISQTARQWGLKSRQAVCMVPSKLFISKNVDMPSNDPEEISKIIDLQAGRYTPYSRDEIVIDYLCMTTAGQHYTNVLLVIVNRKLVDRYVQIFDRAQIMLSRIVAGSEAMAIQYRKLMPADQTSGALAGIHIASDFSDLTILDKREMVFVRSLPVGANHFRANYAGAQQSFNSELTKSIASYQDHGVGEPVRGLILSGMTAGLDTLESNIREFVPAMKDPSIPIRFFSYQKHFTLGPAAAKALEAPDLDSSFELMSCVASEDSLKIDLIPKEIKIKRKFREGGREIITLGILIMTCLVMICVFLASKIYIKKDLINRLEETADSISPQARVLERASTKSRVLRNLIEYRGKGTYVFDKVTSLIGEDLYLSIFSYDQEGKIHLVGTAQNMSGVFAFVTKLEDSGYFSSVTTNETKTRKEGSEEVADFDIDCMLIGEI